MLSPDAMDILDELLSWFIWGGVAEGSIIKDYRDQIDAFFP